MPDFTTHYLFGDAVLRELPEELQTMLEAHRPVFNYGVQGPDVLFFRKVLSGAFSGFSNLPPAGSEMHRKKVGESFDFMKRYIAGKQREAAEYEVLCSYFTGFVCHYYLDKTVHPYVYFLENSICAHHPERTHRSVHAQIESELDSILYERLEQKPVTSFPLAEVLNIDTFSKNAVSKMLTELLGCVFGVETEVGEVMHSFDDMKNVSRMLYDGSGILTAARGVLGKAFPKTLDMTNQIKTKTVRADTANLSENLWHHPERPEQKSRKSVLALFCDAKDAVVPALLSLYSDLGSGDPVLFDTSLDFSGNTAEG